MTKPTHVSSFDRYGGRRAVLSRNTPTSECWYDNGRQPAPHVLAIAQRYDPKLFFRFNRAIGLSIEDCGRWELWRWRTENPGRPPFEHERGRSALFCYAIHNEDGTFVDVDERVVQTIIDHDMWARHGQVTNEEEAEKFADKLEREEFAQDAKEEAAVDAFTDDWCLDHKRQIAEFFGHSSPIFVMPGKKLIVP